MEKEKTKQLGNYLVVLILAIGFTMVTLSYQKKGPFMGVYGNLCGPGDTGELCIEPILQAGWPLPYLLDSPGISVRGKLFIEDDINFGFFTLDVFFFACCINMIWKLIKRD